MDAFFYIFLSVLLFALSNTVMPHVPAYAEVIAKRESIQADSGLYVDGQDIAAYVASAGSPYTTVATQKDYLSDKLETFYQTQKYCPVSALSEYRSRQALARSSSGLDLFELVDGKLVERPLAPQEFLTFYTGELRNHALAALFQNEGYLKTTQTIYLVAVGQGAFWATANYFFFYLIVPVCLFRNGRQTFGRKIFRLGYVNRHAISPRRGNFMLRSLVEYLFFVPLAAVTFLIPLFISAGMLFLSETSQDLPDYLFGHYMVDVSKDDVYSDPSQYHKGQGLHEKSLLTDKDFQIEQNHI